MRVLGYGRVSQDDQETSPQNQKDTIINEFCKGEDTDELGQENHEFVDFYCDEHVSGLSNLLNRPEFVNLLEHAKEDGEIDAIVVKEFPRLSRSDYIVERAQEEIQKLVDDDLMLVTAKPWMFGLRQIPEMHPNAYNNEDDPLDHFSRKWMFKLFYMMYEFESVAAKDRSQTGLKQQKNRGGALGGNPRGLVTPKVAWSDSNRTDEYVPVETADSDAIRDWEEENGKDWEEEHEPLGEVLTVLDIYLSEGTSPMESYADPKPAGTVAKEMGWGGETTAVRNVWKAKEDYAAIAVEFEDECDYEVPESVRELD